MNDHGISHWRSTHWLLPQTIPPELRRLRGVRRLEQGCLRIRDKERYRLTHVLWPQPNQMPTSCPASFSQRFQWGLLDSVCTSVLYLPLASPGWAQIRAGVSLTGPTVHSNYFNLSPWGPGLISRAHYIPFNTVLQHLSTYLLFWASHEPPKFFNQMGMPTVRNQWMPVPLI